MDNNQQEPAKLKNAGEAVNERVGQLLTEVTLEKLSLARISAYATAGLSFASILVLVSIKPMSVPLHVAAISLSMAIPLLVFVANLHESFIWYGERSFNEYKKMAHRKSFQVILVGSYGFFALGFFAMLWYVSVWASLLSFFVSFILLLTDNFVANKLAQIMGRKGKEGA